MSELATFTEAPARQSGRGAAVGSDDRAQKSAARPCASARRRRACSDGSGGQAPERDVFAFVRALDEAGRGRCGRGSTVEWPIALFDGERTSCSTIPARRRIRALPDARRPRLAGRYPAVVGNSTREIGGSGRPRSSPRRRRPRAPCSRREEVFHVFWLSRHTNFRPNEMARYAYPVTDAEPPPHPGRGRGARAGARGGGPAQAAGWAARRSGSAASGAPAERRRPAFETGLEMMEGTANYVARVAVGQKAGATAARLRPNGRRADPVALLRHGHGAVLPAGPVPARLEGRIDGDLELTTVGLLERPLRAWTFSRRRSPRPDVALRARAGGDTRRFGQARASSRGAPRTRGTRIVVEVAEGDERSADAVRPDQLFVLDGGEVVHPNYLTFSCPGGTLELTNPGLARMFGGTVALTRGAGRHRSPMGSGR